MKRTILNGSLITAVICFLLWIMGAGKIAEAEVLPKQSHQTDNIRTNTPAIPEIVTDYVLIYKPQPDVYKGRDTKNYKSGEIYYKWQPNDHTFTQGPNGRWHCIGITRPDDVLDDETHEGGGPKFHALAPFGTLEQAFLPETWIDQPKIVFGGAPYVIKIQDTYHLINSAYDHLTSNDLYNWKNNGKLQIKREKGKDTRDPNVLYWNGTYYLVNCNDRSVNLVTSTDFVNWSDPIDIFIAPVESWRCESPTLLRYNNKFYLFWCLWDSSPSREKLLALYKDHTPWSYDYRTYVYVSDTPTDFNNTEPIAELKGHAPEIFQDEKGNWFISSVDYPQRGINLARLEWKSGPKSPKPVVVEGYDKPLVVPKGYKLVENLSDEFNGEELDETKWMPRSNDGWTGRGARFMEDNVIVTDGCLQLKSSVIGSDADLKSLYKDLEDIYVKDKSLHMGDDIDVETWSPAIYGKKWVADWSTGAKYKNVMRKGLNTIGAAIVCSKRSGKKGYYEARMKLSEICMSSSFWLQGFHTTEFDITESYGSYTVATDNPKVLDAPYRVHTSVWVNTREFKGKGGIKPKSTKWKTRLCDDFFVLGLKWEDERLSVYINDEFQYSFSLKDIRTEKGNLPIPIETYASPQYIKFDTEILLGPEMGWPTKKELRDSDRNTFYVDWIRVWEPTEKE